MCPINGKVGIQTQAVDAKPVPITPKLYQLPGGKIQCFQGRHTLGSHFLHFHIPVYLQVSLVLSALQAGNKGTQACITAATAVSGIIADLDTTIMFATAGTLNAENSETFADHRYVERFRLPCPETHHQLLSCSLGARNVYISSEFNKILSGLNEP